MPSRPWLRRTALGVFTLCATHLPAQTIRPGFDLSTLGPLDDGSVEIATIGFATSFYGVAGPLFINNNGNLTFGSAYESFTPGPLSSTGVPMLAPFFADVDTRASNAVTYGAGTVGTRNAFGVNWLGVGYFDSELVPPGLDRRNSFQLLLIDRADIAHGDFDIEFNYSTLQWESGNAAGGIDGLGGDDCARAGWTDGSSVAEELPGSGVCGALITGGAQALDVHSNSDEPGRFRFAVRNGVVVTAQSTVPEPSTYALMSVGLLSLWGAARRRATRGRA